MKKFLSLVLFGAFCLFTRSAYAGHDSMEEIRKASALIKEESCSNGKTKIEYRLGDIMGSKFSFTLVILEPDAAFKKSEWYRESNKDFYSLIFYKFSDTKDATDARHLMKRDQSGNLEELTAPEWLKEIEKADLNAAKSLTNKPGSDCKTTYQAPKR